MNIIIANTINIQVAWLKVDNSKEWVIQMTLIFLPWSLLFESENFAFIVMLLFILCYQ